MIKINNQKWNKFLNKNLNLNMMYRYNKIYTMLLKDFTLNNHQKIYNKIKFLK